MAHATAGRRSLAGDESDDRLLALLFDEFGCLLLVRAADLPDHDDRRRLGIGFEGGETVNEIRPDQRIATDADAARLPKAVRRELVNDLVRQRAAPRHDADLSRLADAARDDADLALAGRDEAGTVRTDEPSATLVHVRERARHVEYGNPFRDTDDQLDAGIGRLVDGRCGDRRGHVDHRGIRLCRVHRFGHGVEHGDGVFEPLAAFAGRHTGNHRGAVGHHLLRVKRTVAAGYALYQEAGRLIDEDAHAALPFPVACATACLTASSMSVSAENPAFFRISTAMASFVPMRRMTIGTLSANSRVACTMPLATSSARVMPANTLKRIDFTLGSEVMMRSAATTFCGFELPPMSRKLAGSPP